MTRRCIHIGVTRAPLLMVAGMLVAMPALSHAQERPPRPEAGIGVFEHGANFHPLGSQLIFDLPDLPDGQVYDGLEEEGTVDIQLATVPRRSASRFGHD